LLAQFEYARLRRWHEVVQVLLGFWLAASPFIFGYAADGVLRFWHLILGALTVMLAGVELWQDWNLTDEELAQHGE
jgi:hypothetical protein